MKRDLTAFFVVLLVISLAFFAPPLGDERHSHHHGIMHEVHGSPEQVEIAEWNEVVAPDARDTATNAAEAYAHPDLPEADWIKGLEPNLSESAKNTFQRGNSRLPPARDHLPVLEDRTGSAVRQSARDDARVGIPVVETPQYSR